MKGLVILLSSFQTTKKEKNMFPLCVQKERGVLYSIAGRSIINK